MADFPFIGRQDALNSFHSLLSLRAQKSSLYIEATGGLGKTWLLKEYIRQSLKSPRWYLCHKDFDSTSIDSLIIDFFHSKNRSIEGLIDSIVERLGRAYFTSYSENLKKIKKLTADVKDIDEHIFASSIASLRRRSEEVFFREFKNAIRDIDGYVLLIFDTFEVAHQKRVGRWFLDRFLNNQATSDCIIVFAGRPPTPALPYRVIPHPLYPWKKEETIEYLTRRWPNDFNAPDAEHIHMATSGHPLLVDMVVYTRNAGLADLSELTTTSRTSLEWSLIDRFARNPVGEHSAIIELGYLKRRFDPEIFSVRQQGPSPAYEGINDFDTLVKILRLDTSHAREGLNSITKYRHEDQVLSVHDEVQRMIAEHAYRRDPISAGSRTEWQSLCKELYNEIVCKWYPDAIKKEKSEEKRNLLIAEQLGYELDTDIDNGLKIYANYFAGIKKSSQASSLAFNELIWGEVVDLLHNKEKSLLLKGREYELCYGQADWLWQIGQFDAAAEIYKDIIENYTLEPDDILRRLEALASLGHSYMQLGKYELSKTAFDAGLKLAIDENYEKWISAFQQNIGQLLQLQNQWDEAERHFEDATIIADTLKDDNEAQALPSLYLGSLQALLGKYNEAIINCQKALSNRREAMNAVESETDTKAQKYKPLLSLSGGYYSEDGRKIRLGIAYLKLADVYRYSGKSNWSKSKENYNKALDIFSSTNQARYKSEALQGLGNIHYEESRFTADKREKEKLIIQALDVFEEAITICRDFHLEHQTPKALHRFAHVFFEIHSDRQLAKHKTMLRRIAKFDLPEEEAWLDSRILREALPFTELDSAGKAQRIFEVSSLEAERMGDLNASLDSLVEASRIALYRDRPNDIQTYERLAQVPSKAYQQDLFLALMNLIKADLRIKEHRFDDALKGYAENFPIVVKSSGFGMYLLDDYLLNLKEKLENMSSEVALHWCNSLIASWNNAGLHKSNPELIARLWEYRHIIEEKNN